MINLIKKFIRLSNADTVEVNFFELPSKEKKKLVIEAGRAAQKDQERLLHAYELKFGRS